MGGKYDWDAGFGGGIGNLSQFLHEHRALRGQILDDMLVVHDLAAHIHRRQSVGTWRIGGFENRPHRQNRPIHAGAESARIRQHDAFAHVKPPSNRHPSITTAITNIKARAPSIDIGRLHPQNFHTTSASTTTS